MQWCMCVVVPLVLSGAAAAHLRAQGEASLQFKVTSRMLLYAFECVGMSWDICEACGSTPTCPR
jgi:hypothetical protein